MTTSIRKRILVTGGAGFLGSHLCKTLVEQGNEVLCVDNLHTGSKENILPLLGNPWFEFVRHDITIPLKLEVDEIYNLACPASPIHYQNDPVQTTRTCVNGSINLLELARETGARILQASTSEVYGDPEVTPQSESYFGRVNPVGQRACYDEGKRCAETLFFDYHRQYNLEIKVARIFNTYGPNMLPNDGRVVSNFIVQSLEGNPITIYGKGEQTRSFCFVTDLINALILLMGTTPEFVGPVNLGNPYEISIKELADIIRAKTNSSSPLLYKQLPEDDPAQRCPDITLARRALNWNPKTDFEVGLERTIDWFQRAPS